MIRLLITNTLGAAVIVGVAAALLWAMPVHAARCGKASWYGEAHHGRLMANGKRFNMHALTAASNSLPLGTQARVTAGKRSIVVVITDTGGFAKYGRIIDLSKAAFSKLAPSPQGIAQVCVLSVGGMEPSLRHGSSATVQGTQVTQF